MPASRMHALDHSAVFSKYTRASDSEVSAEASVETSQERKLEEQEDEAAAAAAAANATPKRSNLHEESESDESDSANIGVASDVALPELVSCTCLRLK